MAIDPRDPSARPKAPIQTAQTPLPARIKLAKAEADGLLETDWGARLRDISRRQRAEAEKRQIGEDCPLPRAPKKNRRI